MREFWIGFIVASVILVLSYLSFFKQEITTITETVTVTDTVKVQVIDTLKVQVERVITQVIFLDADQKQYVAILDTTIVQPRVKARLQTKFYHPQLYFDIKHEFSVKSDTTYIHTTQTITNTVLLPPQPITWFGEIYALQHSQKQRIFGIGATMMLYGRFGVNAKLQTNGYFGGGISLRF